MKKLARKKWESDDPAVHKREPQNLENSAQFEIIRQEEVMIIILLPLTDSEPLICPTQISWICLDVNFNRIWHVCK